MKNRIKEIINSPQFNTIILLLIFINSVMIGLQTTPLFATNQIIQIADNIFLYIFLFEVLLKIYANGKFFFYDKWNIFDSIIIVCSLIFTMSMLVIFRTFRLFKFFKTIRMFKYIRIMRFLPNSVNLQKIVASISRSIPKIISTGFLLILVFYIYAVLGVSLYGKIEDTIGSEFFGNIINSFRTLFQVMTGDAWADVIARSIQDTHPSIWVYLISFFIITALTLLSVVTGVIVDSISSVSGEFEKVSTRYNNENHILILGFNEITLYVLEQINSYEKDSSKFTKQRVLVLDNGDADKNRFKVMERLGDENSLKVEFFSGEIDEKENLEKCNVSHAQSILILDNDETKYAKTILTIQALWRENTTAVKHSPYLAVIVNKTNIYQSLKNAFYEKNSNIHILSDEKIISNTLAHSARKSGFAEIFKELFTSYKNEIHLKDFPKELEGKTFFEAALHYPTSTLIGLVDQGNSFINPKDKNQKITKTHKGIFLSETLSTIKCKIEKDVPTFHFGFSEIQPQNQKKQPETSNTQSGNRHIKKIFQAKHILFVGCNRYLKNIIAELDNYVGKNSTAVISTNNDEKELFQMEILGLELRNFTCSFSNEIDLRDISTIPNKVEVIVFLTNSMENDNEADSEVLLNLLTLINSIQKNNANAKEPKKYRLLCEMRKIENQSIAPNSRGLEYVVGNRLTSQIMAQIALDETLHGIYEELLTSNGSEFYMKEPVEYGFESGEILIFDITARIMQSNEIFIGYKNSNSIYLNPEKSEKINLAEIEAFIVISEN